MVAVRHLEFQNFHVWSRACHRVSNLHFALYFIKIG